jgi:hypothetical protein
MTATPSDTSSETQRMHYRLMREVPAAKRLQLAMELTQAARQLILADLQARFPDANDEEIRRRFIARVLPRKDVIKVYGFDPLDDRA